jgi:outer membrane biosynthesis protein TonB
MDLVGAWLRQLLRAGTAAAIVPAAMVAALVVVLVGAGGFGGLRSLRQVVAGPEISPTQIAAAGPDAPQVGAPARRPARPPVPRAQTPRPVTPAPVVTPPLAAPPPPVVTPPPPPPVVTKPRPPPPPPPPPPPTTPEPVATPKKPALQQTTQNVVDGVDGTLDSVGELLNALIDRLGKLLPPPKR